VPLRDFDDALDAIPTGNGRLVGNLFTVAVATAAIVFSAWNSKRTLELSAKHFRHTREDAEMTSSEPKLRNSSKLWVHGLRSES